MLQAAAFHFLFHCYLINERKFVDTCFCTVTVIGTGSNLVKIPVSIKRLHWYTRQSLLTNDNASGLAMPAYIRACENNAGAVRLAGSIQWPRITYKIIEEDA
jgi:hypothetical protein